MPEEEKVVQKPKVLLPEISQQEIEEGKTMGILAYIFFIIPLIAARDNKFAMFHTEQAIIIAIIAVGLSIIASVLSFTCIIPIIAMIASIGLIVFWIMGLINAIGGKVEVVPLIGSWGRKINLVK
ncbi:hypothetical protein JW877_04230 [bacterium]|nr:hypothetical protein [bacterium]